MVAFIWIALIILFLWGPYAIVRREFRNPHPSYTLITACTVVFLVTFTLATSMLANLFIKILHL